LIDQYKHFKHLLNLVSKRLFWLIVTSISYKY